MKRQFHIQAPGREPIVIDINDKESVNIRVDTAPTAFGHVGPSTFRIDGLRWAGKDHFHLGWGAGEFALNDIFSVALVEDNLTATPLEKEERYTAPEKNCLFCHKTQSNVRYLIDSGVLARICDECVAKCQRAIDERKFTTGSDNVISVKNKKAWWRRKKK